MTIKIEVIKGKVRTENDFEKFRRELNQFAKAHKVVNISTTMDTQRRIIYATILYELQCEECFKAFLTQEQIKAYLARFDEPFIETLQEWCNLFEAAGVTHAIFRSSLSEIGVDNEVIDSLVKCLKAAGINFK
jgi:hypothetical protein